MPRPGISVILFVLVLFSAPAAAAQPYWAVEDGAVLHFASGGGYTVERDGDLVAHVNDVLCVTRYYYRLGEDGDVMFDTVTLHCGFPGEASSYGPPLLLLDLPLVTGKTWNATATWYGADHRVYDTHVNGLVLGPTTAALPGVEEEVPVMAVRLSFVHSDLYGGPLPPDTEETWLLHAQLGRIDGLVAWEGIVADEAATWSCVKALYR